MLSKCAETNLGNFSISEKSGVFLRYCTHNALFTYIFSCCIPQRTWNRSTASCVCRAPQQRQKIFWRCCLVRGGVPQMICRTCPHWPFSSDRERAFAPDLPTSFTCCSLCHVWERFWVTSARALGLLGRRRAQDRVRQQQTPHAPHSQSWGPPHRLFCPADPLLLCRNTCAQGYSQTNLVCLGWTGMVISGFLREFWD